MEKTSRIFIAGASGMVGSAIIRRLLSLGHTSLVGSYHSKKPEPAAYLTPDAEALSATLSLHPIDLMQTPDVMHFFSEEKPDYVFLAAARVGGIHANNTYPARFIHENLVIQSNIIHAAFQAGVKRLLFLGSSCIYPKLAPQPMTEDHLLTGALEPTNESYAVAKIAGIKMCEAYNREHGTKFAAVMPTNLYGPNDNFDLAISHVLPALIRKCHEAMLSGEKNVMVWGTGTPKREFLHVDDMADACIHIMNLDEAVFTREFLSYPKPCFVNVGTGTDLTIRELAETVARVVGYTGNIVFDTDKPDGTPRKLLDVSRLSALGWRPRIDLFDGIQSAYHWYLKTAARPQ